MVRRGSGSLLTADSYRSGGMRVLDTHDPGAASVTTAYGIVGMSVGRQEHQDGPKASSRVRLWMSPVSPSGGNPGASSVGGQVDHAHIGETVECQLNTESRQQEAEHLLGDQHPTLVQMIADPARPTEHHDVQDEDHREKTDHNRRESDRANLS